jgi:hypothetical protein
MPVDDRLSHVPYDLHDLLCWIFAGLPNSLRLSRRFSHLHLIVRPASTRQNPQEPPRFLANWRGPQHGALCYYKRWIFRAERTRASPSKPEQASGEEFRRYEHAAPPFIAPPARSRKNTARPLARISRIVPQYPPYVSPGVAGAPRGHGQHYRCDAAGGSPARLAGMGGQADCRFCGQCDGRGRVG